MGPEGSVIHSNLMPSFDKMQTPISHWTGGSSPVQLTFRLPNGDAAVAFQRSLIGTEQGPYDLARNSCLTHVCDVLREGGVDDIPTNGLFRWAGNGAQFGISRRWLV
jgi:hypothetical protein